MAKPLEKAERLEVKTRSELRKWLENNHNRTSGVWLIRYKETLILPHDLESACTNNAIAYQNCLAFPSSVKKGTLEWIKNAKRQETRVKRITETVSKAVQNVRANY